MKFLATLLAISLSFSMQAQSNSAFGLKGGLVLGLDADDVAPSNFKKAVLTGFTTGVFYRFNPKRFLLHTELVFTRKGGAAKLDTDITDSGGNIIGSGVIRSKNRLDYLEVPLLLGVQFTRLGFAVGPYASYNLQAVYDVDFSGTPSSIDFSESQDFTSIDNFNFGLAASVFYRIPLGGIALIFEGRYNIGLTKYDYELTMNNITQAFDTRQQSIYLTAGLEF